MRGQLTSQLAMSISLLPLLMYSVQQQTVLNSLNIYNYCLANGIANHD